MLTNTSKAINSLFFQSPTKLRAVPLWAQSHKVPTAMRVTTIVTSIPLIAGGIALHVMPEVPQWSDKARDALDLTLRYGACLLTFQFGITFGLQACKFALPVQHKAMLSIPRTVAPFFAVLFSSFAIRMAMDMGSDAPLALAVGTGLLWNLDYIYHKFCMQPTWFARWRWGSMGIFLGAMGLCLFSEQLLVMGKQKEIY